MIRYIKNILIICCYFFAVSFSFSQGGEVLYKQKMVEDLFNESKKEKIGEQFSNQLDFINESLQYYSNKFESRLNFNKQESLFKFSGNMENEAKRGYKIATSYVKVYDIIYYNTSEKLKLVQTDFYGDKFLVQYNTTKLNWALHNKTKYISNYKCYMATTTKIVKNSKGVFEKPVIAWYTPEIPFNFGPKGYGNLPGLIMELQEDKMLYYATQISIDRTEPVKIKKPTSGKLITEEEYEKIINKTLNNYWQKM